MRDPRTQSQHGSPTRRIVMVAGAIGIVGILLVLLRPAVNGGPPSKRFLCSNNLRNLGLALHLYHRDYGCFPPAFVADANGTPMHSWRVLILPYLDEMSTYRQYRFDEPWDGPNNSRLAASLKGAPKVFRCPADEEGNETSYVAIVGERTAWVGAGIRQIDDVSDGVSNTVFVAEIVNSGIHWMEPRDLHILQMAPTVNPKDGQGISSLHAGANVLMGDGTIRFLKEETTAAELRRLLIIDDGDSETPVE